jgi:WD40 repeat protein
VLRTLVTPAPTEITRVRWSPDGASLVAACGDHVVRMWNARSGALVLSLDGHGDEVTGVAFSHDGALIASTSNDLATLLWDASTGRLLASFEADSDGVNDVVFSRDGSRLVTVSADHLAHVWLLRYETRPPAAIDAIAERARR